MRPRSAAALLLMAIASCSGGSDSEAPPVIDTIIIADILTAVNPGRPLQLVLFAFAPSGALIYNPGAFVWSSTDPTVATVTQTGLVSPLAPGTTTIAAALGGAVGTMDVVVSAPTVATRDTIVTLPQIFYPQIVTVVAGEAVTFAFGGGDTHNLVFRTTNPPGSPSDIPNARNLVFTRTFPTRGIFNYDCLIHHVSGQIVVQ